MEYSEEQLKELVTQAHMAGQMAQSDITDPSFSDAMAYWLNRWKAPPERMTIHQCELKAQELGYDCTYFDLCGPNGRKRCKWDDAYMGIVTSLESGKLFSVESLYRNPSVWAENVSLTQ